MKPILVKVDENNNVKLSFEELEKLVDVVYEAGKSDSNKHDKSEISTEGPICKLPTKYTTSTTPIFASDCYKLTSTSSTSYADVNKIESISDTYEDIYSSTINIDDSCVDSVN